MVSANMDPLEARRTEREIQGEVNQLLTAFVVAGITEQDLKKGKAARGKGNKG